MNTELTYNRLASVICSIAIALSLGEIASIYPTAGGKQDNHSEYGLMKGKNYGMYWDICLGTPRYPRIGNTKAEV